MLKPHWLLIITALMLPWQAQAKSAACSARMINPISDICWKCMFPMTLGKVPLFASKYPDTRNPAMPVSYCPKPPPVYMQIGLNIGYWEPYSLVDVTRVPYCMVNMGMQLFSSNSQQVGGSQHVASGQSSGNAFYHVHWYKYPLIYWLQLMQSAACMATDVFDIAYMSEIDPFWEDDEMAFILNPEAILFGDPVTQLACATEAMATTTGRVLPFDALFWCLGSQGSVYPLTGNSAYSHTGPQVGTLMLERFNFKMHRQGIVWETRGESGAICYQWPEPILPKSRYRYQLSAPIPDAGNCYPYGTTSTLWEHGKDNPTTGGNFGFVNWRKRNCVFL